MCMCARESTPSPSSRHVTIALPYAPAHQLYMPRVPVKSSRHRPYFSPSAKKNSCSSSQPRLTNRAGSLHAYPEFWTCTMGTGRSWSTAHAQSSRHMWWAPVLSVVLGAKKVAHHWRMFRGNGLSSVDLLLSKCL